MSEPSASGPSVAVEYALRHPTGHVDAVETATTFGPTPDLNAVREWLEVADSDCCCTDDIDNAHAVVTRTITVTDWTSLPSDSAR